MTLLARARTTDDSTPVQAPVLQTARLLLRAPRRSDAKPYAMLAGDRRIATNVAHIPSPCGVEVARQWIATEVLRRPVFVITAGDELIGACSLDGRDGVPDLWYWIGVPFWGYGYATEAVRGVVGYAFGDLGHTVLSASSRVTNPLSRRVLDKCGFRWTGVGLCRIRALGTSVPVDRFVREAAA